MDMDMQDAADMCGDMWIPERFAPEMNAEIQSMTGNRAAVISTLPVS